MDKQPKSQLKNLKSTLMDRIESENVCPRSRLFFRSKECFVWTLWLFSVILGAFAVAVSLFVMTHHQYALYEATHDNFFTFLVDVLPYLWVIVFASMVGLAVLNLKNTKRGYKHTLSFVVVSSVILSFAGGSALQFFGLGYSIDSILGKEMKMYMSQEKREQKLWQSPEEGRLLGQQVFATVSPTTTVVFQDMAGERWRMEVVELEARDIELLASEQQVRVLGQTMSTTSKVFHACGVFPWMVGREVTMADMSKERQDFVRKVYDQKHRAEERLALMEESAYRPPHADKMGICAEHAAVRRISDNMNGTRPIPAKN